MKYKKSQLQSAIALALFALVIMSSNELKAQHPEVTVGTSISCGIECDYTATFSGLCPGDTLTTITWSNGQTGPIVTGLCGGTQYWVALNGPCVCDTIYFTTPYPLGIWVGQDCDYVSAYAWGGVQPYEFEWISNNPFYYWWYWTGSYMDVAWFPELPGTYTVTVTDAQGCTMSMEIDVEAFELEIDVTGVDPTCDLPNGSIDVTATGTGTPFSYHWKKSGSNQHWYTSSVQNLGSGTYWVTVTDVNGCYETGHQTLTNSGEILTFVVDTISCVPVVLPWGDTAWVDGTYTVYDSLPLPCGSYEEWNVTIAPILSGDTTSVVVCEGAVVEWNNEIYDSTGFYWHVNTTGQCPIESYLQLSVLDGSATVVMNESTCNPDLIDSVFVVNTMTIDGCLYDSVVVWQYEQPDNSIVWLADCIAHQDSVVVASGSCPDTITYKWNVIPLPVEVVNDTTCDLSVPAIWYSYGVTSSGCTVDTLHITTYDYPINDIVWLEDCIAHQDSVVIASGSCPDTITYKWNIIPAVIMEQCENVCWGSDWVTPTGDTLSVTQDTTFTTTFFGMNGDCDTTVTILVKPLETFSDTLINGSPQYTCGPISEILTVYDTTAVENCIRKIYVYPLFVEAYEWEFVDVEICADEFPFELTDSLTVLDFGTYTVQDSCAMTAYTVIEAEAPIVILSVQQPSCGDTTGIITVIYQSEGSDLFWMGSFISLSNDTITALPGDTVILSTMNDASCERLDTVIIAAAPDSISLDLSTEWICGEETGNVFAIASGGSGEFSYSWNGSEGVFDTEDIENASAGYYSVTVIDNMTGCTATADIILNTPLCPEEDDLSCRWRIYPNPVKAGNTFFLEMEGWGNDEMEITLISPDGSSKKTSEHQGTMANQIIQLNAPPNAGVWILSMKNKKKCISAKIIVNN